jgi:hypothetical protein
MTPAHIMGVSRGPTLQLFSEWNLRQLRVLSVVQLLEFPRGQDRTCACMNRAVKQLRHDCGMRQRDS